MQVFSLVIQQMLMMFTLMLIGFFLRKMKVFPEKTDISLSKLETFIFVPALNLVNMLKNCNIKNFLENYYLMFYGLGIVLVAIAISYPLSKLFVRNYKENSSFAYKRNIYKYAITFGNYGYLGNFLVLGLWGEEVFFKYTMFTFLISLLCAAWGIYILVPKSTDAKILTNLRKGLITPPTVALIVGIIGGLLNVSCYLPSFLVTALDNASKCMGPGAMILAGIVIGGFEFKSMLTDKKIYIMSFIRLFVIPSFFIVALKMIGATSEVIAFTLVAFASPLGMNTIVYPAAYGGETQTGASMTMISHVLSIVSIPLMFMIFNIAI